MSIHCANSFSRSAIPMCMVVVCVVCLGQGTADASVVVPEKLEEVMPRIHVVVRARVKERQHPVDNNHSRYRYRIEIEEVLLGNAEKGELDVRYYEAGHPDVSVITPASLIEGNLRSGKSYLFLFASINPAGTTGVVLTRAEPLENRAAVVKLANHNLATRWVIECVTKSLPKSWRLVSKKTGTVAPGHWPDGKGVRLTFQREGFTPEDHKRGLGGEVRVWVMRQGYPPKSHKNVEGAQTHPAMELPARHGCRAFVWGADWRDWPQSVGDIRPSDAVGDKTDKSAKPNVKSVLVDFLELAKAPQEFVDGIKVQAMGEIQTGGLAYRVVIDGEIAPRVLAVFLNCQGDGTVIQRVRLPLVPMANGERHAEFIAKRSPQWNVIARLKIGDQIVDYTIFRDAARP